MNIQVQFCMVESFNFGKVYDILADLMCFESDSAQPNQCISGPHRNKKKFSSDCEVYEGVKKGGGKGGGNLSIGL